MAINSSALNTSAINSAGGPAPPIDWTDVLAVERQSVYLLDIAGLIVPISSVQATMRLTGASYMQAVVPAAGELASGIIAAVGSAMHLMSGYRYADDSLSDLETIASAPLQQISRATGPVSDTITISGYGPQAAHDTASHALSSVQTRTVSADGRRRVRCGINLLLRPGHTAVDSDSVEFTAGVIQYFINSQNEIMEVYEDG